MGADLSKGLCMKQYFYQVILAFGLCWIAMFALSGCLMDQATAYKAIAGKPAPTVYRTLAGGN